MPDTVARFVAYADGSSLQNPGGPGGIGFIVFDRQFSALRFGSQRFVKDGEYAVTNNRMELRAVLSALDGLPDGATVDVVSDSKYVVDANSKWVHGWRKRGWKTAEGSPVLNRDLFEAIGARARPLRLRYQWVRGHNGNALNELVDGLANSAARGVPGPTREDIIPSLSTLLVRR